jgi:hypothetical protein
MGGKIAHAGIAVAGGSRQEVFIGAGRRESPE